MIDHEKKEAIRVGKTCTNEEIKALVKERMMGTALLKRSAMSMYGPTMTNIRDQFGYEIDLYLKSLAAAYDILEDYARSRKLYPKRNKLKEGDDKYRKKGGYPDKDEDTGVMYSQEDLVTGTNRKIHASIKYHRYNNYGYYLSHCPEVEGSQNLNIKEEEQEEEEDDDEGVNHMQVLETLNDGGSLSSDGSYMVNFRNFQFL